MSELSSILLLLLYMGCASFLLGGTKAANFTLLNVYQPPHMESEIGLPLNLACEFNYTGDSYISEMMFAKFYTKSNHIVDYVVDVKCDSIYEDTVSCKLSLTINPTVKDETVYHCEVVIPLAEGIIEVRGAGTNLSLHVDPSSIEIRAVPLLVSGRDTMVLCMASGFYPGNPSVFWFHRGLPVPPSDISTNIIQESNGTFYLHTVYRFIPTGVDHTGVCLCQVSHPAWKQQWEASAMLNVSLEPVSMDMKPLSLLVSGNESILLCTASQFNPGNPSVLWFHRNLSVPTSSIANDIIVESDGIFSLRSQYRFTPTEADHIAECFCQVSHPSWTEPCTANITLNVRYGPSAVSVMSPSGFVANGFMNVAVGSTVNLSCAANGNPSPKVQWLRGDITEPNSTDRLYIPLALKEDGGLYWCVAQNQYGERNTSITLLVTESVVSTCLLVKLLLIGMLILLDIIMFTIYIIRKIRMGRSKVQGPSVSQTSPPQGERSSLEPAMAPEPDSLSTNINQIPPD